MDFHNEDHHHDHDHNHDHHHDHHHHHHHSELDDLKHQHGTDIYLEGDLKAPIDKVWEVLTSNNYVRIWFPELTFESLKSGGKLLFDSKDFHSEMMIYDVEAPSLLSFEWGEGNIVTFELMSNDDQTTHLNYTQWIHHLDEEHSAKDITGWLICMQKIAALVEEKPLPDTLELYHDYYEDVAQLVKEQSPADFE